MKTLHVSTLLLAIGSVGWATPISRSLHTRNQPNCRDVVIPVQAEAHNTKFPPFPNSTASGVMYQYLASFNSSALPSTLISGTFNISATFCEPTVSVQGRTSTIQVLIHGLSATKEYWNGYNGAAETFTGEYSYVAHAQSQGYSTLAVDSLGNGQSSHPDPLSIVQGSLQVAILQNIIQQLRNGSAPSLPKYQKVIFASHSYGSILARLVATFFPQNGADAYVLTAASNILVGLQSFIKDTNARSVSAVKPQQFGSLAPGYVAINPSSIRDILYPLDGQFDPKMLRVDMDQPHIFAVGEIAAAAPAIPSNFTGPVLVITGRQDQIVCGNGNITSLVPDCGVGPGSKADAEHVLFPKSSQFDSYVPDQSAHVINSQYSAPEAFGAAHQWLETVGF